MLLQRTKFTVDTDNGNTDIQGTLDVAGDLTAHLTLQSQEILQ